MSNYSLKHARSGFRQRRSFDFSIEFSTSQLRAVAILTLSDFHEVSPAGLALKRQRRNYSPATTRGYILAVKQIAEYFGKSPEELGAEEIRRFQLYLLNEKKLAPGTVETRMSALRFLYKKTLKRRDPCLR